jgi:hypothetical protein
MSHCGACEKLRAELAQKDAQLALKISEIRDLRVALANRQVIHSPPGDGSPNLRIAPLPSAHLPALPSAHLPALPSAHLPADSHLKPAASNVPVLHSVATSERAGDAHGGASAQASLRPSDHAFASASASSDEKHIFSSKSEPPSSRENAQGVRDMRAADVSDALQASRRAAAISEPSDDDDLFQYDPLLKSSLHEMFGHTFSLSFIEKILDQVRWNEDEAVLRLLSESESAAQQHRPLLPASHGFARHVAQPALQPNVSRLPPQKSSNSIASVKLEDANLNHVQLKPTTSSSPVPSLDVKRLKIDIAPQVKKLKADICHEMQAGRDCLHLIKEFQYLCPATWFVENLIGSSGFPGPRIFHLACCSDTFSSTLSFLMERVISLDRSAQYCRELMTQTVCAAFVDWNHEWNKTFVNTYGTDKKRVMPRIPRRQAAIDAGPDKLSYSLGLKSCALHIVAHHGALSCAAILLKMAQCVKSSDLKSPFIAALLLQGGSVKDVKYREFAPSPLDLASAAGHVNVMRLFINHVRQFGPHAAMTPKSFVNHRGGRGSCALHWAAECCKFESIEFLLQQGADPEAKDDTGGTAIEYVINNASRQPASPVQVMLPFLTLFSLVNCFLLLLYHSFAPSLNFCLGTGRTLCMGSR